MKSWTFLLGMALAACLFAGCSKHASQEAAAPKIVPLGTVELSPGQPSRQDLGDGVEGKMGLTRGQWVKFGRLLGLPTTYALRPGEQDGVPCWEICFPPVSLVANKK